MKRVKAGDAYNPDVAKKLLAEAGYPKGFKAALPVRSTEGRGTDGGLSGILHLVKDKKEARRCIN